LITALHVIESFTSETAVVSRPFAANICFTENTAKPAVSVAERHGVEAARAGGERKIVTANATTAMELNPRGACIILSSLLRVEPLRSK
jgi:hypothetical protein